MPTGDEGAATVSTATAEFLGVGGTQSRGASRFGFKSEAPLSLPVELGRLGFGEVLGRAALTLGRTVPTWTTKAVSDAWIEHTTRC